MNYIVTNVDQSYFEKNKGNWVPSVLKYKKDSECKIFWMSSSDISIPNVDILKINPNDLKYSKHPNIKNRPNFICLQSGEFLNYFDFKDDDVLTLCDWDITMQREMTSEECNILHNLGNNQFGMNKDNYPKNNLISYLGLNTIFDDIDPNWIVFNSGILTAKISAWRLLFSYWKEYSGKVFEKCTHHAASQAIINYIVQKHNMIKEMPLTYHNAHWFAGTPAKVINNQLYINNELVLFNHHKFGYTPNF